MHMPRALAFIFALALSSSAEAQQVPLQGGAWTPGHMPQYVGAGSQPILMDGGGSGGGAAGVNLSEFGVTSRSKTGTYPSANSGNGPNGEHGCMYDAPITNATGYHYLCLDPNAQGGGLISYGAAGGATALPLYAYVNGAQVSLGSFPAASVSILGGVYARSSYVGATGMGNGANLDIGPLQAGYSSAAGLGSAANHPTGNAADKALYVSTAGSDANDGLSWGSAKLSIQAGIDAAATAGDVYVVAGVYTLTSAVKMRPGVRVKCNDGAILTQASGANLGSQVDFSSNSADGAVIESCTIDGNSSANTLNFNNKLIYISQASNVTVKNNVIKNTTGVAVFVSSGVQDTIDNNIFTNTYGTSVFVVGSSVSTPSYCKIINNKFSIIGVGVMTIANADYCIVDRNMIVGSIIGAAATPMTVNISGTAVTWVSGPQFTGAKPGQWLVQNDGEYSILSVNSATSITLDAAGPTVSGALASIQPVDHIGVQNASYTQVTNNQITGGGNYGVAVSATYSTEVTQKNVIANNYIVGMGKDCISVVWFPGNPVIKDTYITGNTMIDCGQSAGALGAGVLDADAISIQSNGAGGLLNTYVDLNTIIDDQATPTIKYWLYIDGPENPHTVEVGPGNQAHGVANAGVYQGIASITLSAGWGSTASTSAIQSYGGAFTFTAQAGGSGISATPNIIVNLVAGKPSQGGSNVIWQCKMSGGSGAIASLSGDAVSTPSYVYFQYNGTPVSGNTYAFTCQ